MSNKRERSNYLIQSVKHATDVLEALANAKEEVGITTLSKKLGLHKNNIFRLLATLSLQGLVQQNPRTEDYALGPACLKLGQSYLLNSDLITRIRPYLLSLQEAVEETVSFARLINQDVHYPISISSRLPVAVAPRLAKTIKAQDCASGNLLLAHDAAAQSISSPILKNLAGQESFTDIAKLEKEVVCVAMLVRGIGGAVIGAVEITAPAYRAKAELLQKQLEKTVTQINACFSITVSDTPEKLTQKIQAEVVRGSEAAASANPNNTANC